MLNTDHETFQILGFFSMILCTRWLSVTSWPWMQLKPSETLPWTIDRALQWQKQLMNRWLLVSFPEFSHWGCVLDTSHWLVSNANREDHTRCSKFLESLVFISNLCTSTSAHILFKRLNPVPVVPVASLFVCIKRAKVCSYSYTHHPTQDVCRNSEQVSLTVETPTRVSSILPVSVTIRLRIRIK